MRVRAFKNLENGEKNLKTAQKMWKIGINPAPALTLWETLLLYILYRKGRTFLYEALCIEFMLTPCLPNGCYSKSMFAQFITPPHTHTYLSLIFVFILYLNAFLL